VRFQRDDQVPEACASTLLIAEWVQPYDQVIRHVEIRRCATPPE
jgi:hypothetical protein